MLGDESRLRQVVMNLVSNAVTHTPAGTPVAVTLEVTPAEDDGPDRVLLAVTDQGRACPRRTAPRCSSGSTGPTRPAPGRQAAAGSGCPSWPPWWPRTAAGSASSPRPGEGSRFLVELPAAQRVSRFTG